MPSGNSSRHVMDVDFMDNVDGDAMDVDFMSNVDGDAMNINILDGCTPSLQTGFENPSLPPALTTDYGFSDLSWSYTGATSSGAPQLFQNEPSWTLGNQGHKGESPSYSLPSSPPLGNTSQQSQKSLSTIVDYALHEVGSNSLAPFSEPRTTGSLPILKLKPTHNSLDVTTGSNSNIVAIQPRKPGRRSGPLDAERRKGASQMRRDRACVTCKLRKTRVG
jgi:hypothetical protein